MESMTGYGRASAERGGLRIGMEIRGVNHKGLDVHLMLPPALMCHELACRRIVRERVSRGHMDVRVSLEFMGEEAVEVRYSEGVARALGHLSKRLTDEGALSMGMTLGDLLSLPGAVQVGLNPTLEDAAGVLLQEALDFALDGFLVTRHEEGRRLKDQFDRGEGCLAAFLERLDPLLPAQVEAARLKLAQRVAQVAVSVDPARLEQEVALAAERADVAEEFERLKSHRQALTVLLAEGVTDRGKRLDHLLQEMQREISTLLAKAGLMEITQIGLDMRLLVEQLREQAQNVA